MRGGQPYLAAAARGALLPLGALPAPLPAPGGAALSAWDGQNGWMKGTESLLLLLCVWSQAALPRNFQPTQCVCVCVCVFRSATWRLGGGGGGVSILLEAEGGGRLGGGQRAVLIGQLHATVVL